jgi:hypothetical protein
MGLRMTGWRQQEIVNELRAIATRASDAKARLLNTRDAHEHTELTKLLATLYRRHEELTAMLEQRKSA